MGGGIGASANLDVLIVLGFLVMAALAIAWSVLRSHGEAPPDPTVGLPEAPPEPWIDSTNHGHDALQLRLCWPAGLSRPF